MRPILIISVIAVVAIIVYLGWPSAPPPPDIEPRASSEAEPAETAVAPDPQEADAEPAIKPSFDVVRISPEGNAVIAGRAEPGAEVEITDGGVVIATVTADDRGEWVALPEAAIEPGNRQLALTQRTVEGQIVESDTVVVLAVPERADDGSTADQGALVLVMPKDDIGVVRLLQEPAGGVGLKGSESLSLYTIEYDDTGAFALGGRAEPGSRIAVHWKSYRAIIFTTDSNASARSSRL